MDPILDVSVYARGASREITVTARVGGSIVGRLVKKPGQPRVVSAATYPDGEAAFIAAALAILAAVVTDVETEPE